MSQLVADCPRCGAKNFAFSVTAGNKVGQSYGWKNHYEIFSTCSRCLESTIFLISDKNADSGMQMANVDSLLALPIALNNFFEVDRYVCIRDMSAVKPPDHVPDDIAEIFEEAATCIAVECWNAAGTMFRLCLDLATRSMLPPEGDPARPNWKACRDLGLRLPWLFENGLLPGDLHGLSTCVQQDGNDGAHAGTLTKEEALDLLDFTVELLERLYTEPERVKLAAQRRDARRGKT